MLFKTTLLALLTMLAAEVRAQTTASNRQVLQALFTRIAARVDSIVAANGISHIMLASQRVEVQSPERLLYSCLTQSLQHETRALFDSVAANGEQARAGLMIKAQVLKCEVSYLRLRRSGWFRRARVQRTLNVAVDFDLHHTQTRQNYFQGVLAATHCDTLHSNPRQVENAEVAFTLGTWQRQEKSAAWLEPALLTAATGAIVYAFYSLRSQ